MTSSATLPMWKSSEIGRYSLGVVGFFVFFRGFISALFHIWGYRFDLSIQLIMSVTGMHMSSIADLLTQVGESSLFIDLLVSSLRSNCFTSPIDISHRGWHWVIE